MANRGHAFIRGLYAQNQNLTNLVRRSGREAVVSTDSTPKRKRDDENLVAIDSLSPSTESTIFESELYSCLFDQNNRCTIFDLDDPSATTNVPAVEMELERFKLSPSSMDITPSEPPALIQLDTATTPAEMKIAPLPSESETEPKISDREIMSLFDPKIFLEDEPDAGIAVPTMEMKSCRLSPSRRKLPKESSTLMQLSVASAPAIDAVRCAPAPTNKNIYEVAAAMRPRNRPFKNVRERKRRREMKSKYMQLYNLCFSKVVASVVSQPGAEATGLLIPISGSVPPLTLVNHEPSKVDVLGEAIQTFEALDKELSKLRSRNRQLRMNAETYA